MPVLPVNDRVRGEAFITSVSSFLPGDPVGNEDLEKVLGMVSGRPSRAKGPVLRSNGIKSRHYAIDPETGEATYTAAQMAAEAVGRLCAPGFDLRQIESLVCSTSLPDQLMPNHASMVHGELGIPPCEVISTSGVCLSGLAALKYAVSTVRTGESRYSVASAAERASAVMRGEFFRNDTDVSVEDLERRPSLAFGKDFLRFMLSDGAGAMLVEPKPSTAGISLKVEWIRTRSWANEMPACMYAGAEKLENGRLKGWADHSTSDWLTHSIFAVKQDARLLNENIIHYTVERGINELVKETGLDPESVKWFLPHYSSAYFRDKVADGMNRIGYVIPQERWFTNLSTRGNTGSASIYIMLEELFSSGELRAGDRLLCYVPESGRFSTGFMLLTVCEPGAF